MTDVLIIDVDNARRQSVIVFLNDNSRRFLNGLVRTRPIFTLVETESNVLLLFYACHSLFVNEQSYTALYTVLMESPTQSTFVAV